MDSGFRRNDGAGIAGMMEEARRPGESRDPRTLEAYEILLSPE